MPLAGTGSLLMKAVFPLGAPLPHQCSQQADRLLVIHRFNPGIARSGASEWIPNDFPMPHFGNSEGPTVCFIYATQPLNYR